MAEPGAAWQATDVVRKPALPRRRLGKVATDPAALLMAIDEGKVEDDPRYGFSQTV